MKLKAAPSRLQSNTKRRLETNPKPSWRSNKRTAAQRGYNSRWRKARLVFLHHHPLCFYCQTVFNRLTPATLIDHWQPHEGNSNLFWDRTNWRACCSECHNGYKQKLEKQWKSRML